MLKETGTLDGEQPQAYAANIYGNNRLPQQQYNHDLYSNKYNLGWKEYPSQKWGNQLNTNKSMFHLNRGNNHNQLQPLVIQTWKQ